MSTPPPVTILGAGVLGCAPPCLTIDDPYPVVTRPEPANPEAHPAGYVTSAACGYTTGEKIAYAWLPAEVADPGKSAAVEDFCAQVPAVVTAEPLFDPTTTRLRT